MWWDAAQDDLKNDLPERRKFKSSSNLSRLIFLSNCFPRQDQRKVCQFTFSEFKGTGKTFLD